jgi:VWFA-related protein
MDLPHGDGYSARGTSSSRRLDAGKREAWEGAQAVMRRNLLILVLLISGVIAGQARQPPSRETSVDPQPRGSFRTEVNFVEVHAIVTDGSGAFVRDLTLDDFEILEDGRPVAPTVFSLVDVPLDPPLVPAGATEPIEWDVREATDGFDGRIYVLMLDDLHTGVTRTRQVQEVARGFVEQYLGAGDLAAVLFTSGRRDAGQELTGSHRLLLAAIDRFQGRKLPSAGAERLARHLLESGVDTGETQPIRTVEGLQEAERLRDPYALERAATARRTLDAVHNVASWLEDLQGRRKSLLLFSEGLDVDIYEPFQRGIGADALLQDARRAVAAAQRANVAVYGIDPRGLNQFGGLIDARAYSDYPQLPFGNFRGMLNELLLSQESLISLASQTGGLAIVNAGDVAGGLGRIVLDSSRYYLLGYYSDPATERNRFRKIDLRVKRPGLEVRARKGYLPPDDSPAGPAGTGAPASRAVALGKPLPIGTLPLRVFAAPFKGGADGKASVVVAYEVEGKALTFTEDGGRFVGGLEASIVATDERARVQDGDDQSFNLRLLPETHEAVTDTGVRMLSRLDLPAGRYQIRVGVWEAGGASAMVPYDLEVPDYGSRPFAMSGLLLTSSDADIYVTATADGSLQSVLPAPPVVWRSFYALERLTWFTEVYENGPPASRQIDLHVTVREAATGRVAISARDQREVATGDRSATHGFTGEVTLRGLTPGVHILRVEARSSHGGHAVHREIPFNVVAGVRQVGRH